MLAGGGVRAGIGELLGMSLLEVDEGRIVFGLEPDARMTNPLGTVHGGIAATLLDSAMSCAVHTTLAADESYTTLDLHVRYVRAARPDGGPLQVEGSVVHRGRRTATAEGRVTDAEGRLVAHGSVSCIVLATP
ncbi:MAG: PaaI family thioesterase [Actinomycetota bacterium]|nr:PaaI family thioesterase [Actinomycetota bacterium]